MGAAVDSEGELAVDDGVIAPEGALLEQAQLGKQRPLYPKPESRLLYVMFDTENSHNHPIKPLGRYSWLRACSAPRRWVQARDTRIVRFKTLQNHYFCKWFSLH